MISEENIKENIRQWLLKKSLTNKTVSLSTPLLKEKIINSVQIMDLILYIEHLSHGSVKAEQINPNSFNSIDSIYSAFFENNTTMELAQ